MQGSFLERTSADGAVAAGGTLSPAFRRSVSATSTEAEAAAAPRAPALSPRGAASPPGPLIVADPSKATDGQAAVQLLNAVLGAGIVGLPFCFRSCGLVLAAALVLAVLAAAQYSMDLLLLAAHVAGRRTYADLARAAFGAPGAALVGACVAVLNMGSLVAYLNLVADVLSLVAGTIVPPGAEPSRPATLAGVTLCAALPVALFARSPRVLAAVSQASVACLLAFAAVLLTLGAGAGAAPLAALRLWRWGGAFTAFPVITYSFTAHQVLFSVYGGLRAPSVRRMSGVVSRSMGAAAAVYLAVGASGYKAFGARTNGDVLRNLGGGAGGAALQRAVKVGYGLSLLASVPLLLIPLQATFAPAAAAALRAVLGPGADKSVGPAARDGATAAAVLAAAAAVAIAVPNVEHVFGLAGSTASVLIAFILPAAAFLAVSGAQRAQQGASVDLARGSPRWHARRRAAAALLAFGLAAGIACTGSLLANIREENEVVTLAREIAREGRKAAVAVATRQEAATVAQAAGVVDEARRLLNGTAAGVGQALTAVEEATRAAEGARASRPKKQGARSAAKDLKPVLAAAEAIVAQLEAAAAALREALDARAAPTVLDAATAAAVSASSASLAALRAAGEEALAAARDSRAALDGARAAVRAARDSGKAEKEAAMGEALQKAVEAATAAAQKVDDTLEALREAEEEQEAEVTGLVARLGEQRREVEKDAEEEEQRAGAAERGAAAAGSAAAAEEAAEDGASAEGQEQEERQQRGHPPAAKGKSGEEGGARNRTAVAAAAAALEDEVHAGRAVNASQVAQAAEAVADTIVQSAKEAAEAAVGRAKKVDVAVRAIDIAKELAAQESGGAGAGGKQQAANETASAAGDGAAGAAAGAAEKEKEATVEAVEEEIELLLGNLTAVAEASVEKAAAAEKEKAAVAAAVGARHSRKLDPAG